MADYNIKFSYKGIGKQASNIRQRVLQSQKSKKPGMTESGVRENLNAIRNLNTSILKLISSNKELARQITTGGIRSGGGSATGAVAQGAGGFMRGGAASSLAGAGAAGAVIGFSIMKINQVANAYLERQMQQLGSVGTAGARGNRGIYMSGQMGAGMKAYAGATGRFMGRREQAPRSALDIGAIYGLSAEETLRTAGQFQRAGGKYKKAVDVGLGMGIETELPMLLTGMAGILTESVKEGINTSNMSKDMAREIASLTMVTPGSSPVAALNMVKSFIQTGKEVSGGRIGTTKGLYTARAAGELLTERLTGSKREEYIEQLQKNKYISVTQAKRLRGMGEGASFNDIMSAAPQAGMSLLRRFTAENPIEIQKRVRQNIRKEWGDTAVKRQQFSDYALATGMFKTQAEADIFLADRDIPVGAEKKGREIRTQRESMVRKSGAGQAVRRLQARENLLLKYGDSFAETSMKMEKQMLKIAEDAAPVAIDGVKALGLAATGTAEALNLIKKALTGKSERKQKSKVRELKESSVVSSLRG